MEIEAMVTKKLSGRQLLVASFSPTALFILLSKLLLFGRSFGKGEIEPHFVKHDLGPKYRTGFLVSGFYLPNTATADSSFTISFFLHDNNRADPGKPIFSIGEP